MNGQATVYSTRRYSRELIICWLVEAETVDWDVRADVGGLCRDEPGVSVQRLISACTEDWPGAASASTYIRS